MWNPYPPTPSPAGEGEQNPYYFLDPLSCVRGARAVGLKNFHVLSVAKSSIKDGGEKEILKKAVKQIATKNIMQINEWKKANPDCTNSDSKKNNIYLNIVSNSMSGSTKEEQFTNLNKIISKVTKEVVIDK